MNTPLSASPSRELILQALILSVGAAVALGFSRFSYALLLPAMRTTLDWSYAEAGSLNTANALGYLIGTLTTARLVKRMGIGRCFWVSLLLTGAALFTTGLTENYTALLFFRLLNGITCAFTFISGATLASHLAKDGHGGLVLGLYFGGVGTGIFLSGLGLPQAMAYDAGLWPYPWLAMGVLTFIAVFLARPVALKVPTAGVQTSGAAPWRFPIQLWPSLLAYFLFGLGYISYMTFIVAYLRSGAVSTWVISLFWLLLGISVFASAFVWQGLLDKARAAGYALASVLAVVALGTALPLLSTSLPVVLVSGILFGGAFLTVVTAVTNIARCALPAHAWASGIALFTLLFSIGQTIGPMVAGVLADQSNSFTSGFALSVSCLVVAAVLALLQRAQDDPH